MNLTLGTRWLPLFTGFGEFAVKCGQTDVEIPGGGFLIVQVKTKDMLNIGLLLIAGKLLETDHLSRGREWHPTRGWRSGWRARGGSRGPEASG